MTHDTRVADWLGRSGASVKTVCDSFSLSGSGRYRSLEVSVCSRVSQTVVSTTSDWIISSYILPRKPNGLMTLYRKLVTIQ